MSPASTVSGASGKHKLDSPQRMSLFHPSTDQIDLATVLAVLGDQTRLSIVGYLARNEGVQINCNRFADLGSKTNVSYHLAKLQGSGHNPNRSQAVPTG